METLNILLSNFVILRDNGIEVYLMLHSPLCLEVFGVFVFGYSTLEKVTVILKFGFPFLFMLNSHITVL